jgi:hypothetical protein
MSKLSKDIILNATIDKKVMNIDTAVEKNPVALDAVVDTSGGVREVFHDETLDGKGTKKDPLRVNKNIIATKEDVAQKQDKLTAGMNIKIEDNVISSTAQESFFRGRYANWTSVPTNSDGYTLDFRGSKTPSYNDYIVVEDSSLYIPQDFASDPRNVMIRNLHTAGVNYTIEISIEGNVRRMVWTSATTWVALTDWLSVMYVKGGWQIKTTKEFYLNNVFTATANGKWLLYNETPSEAQFYLSEEPGVAPVPIYGSWRFAYHGAWAEDNKAGWKPEYQIEETLPIADETQAGIAKLYTTSGSNTDGAMTQKAVGDAISAHNTATDAHSNIRGVAGGLATLDNNAKVPMSQINDALLGNVSYQGLWNAEENVPFLADPSGDLPSGYTQLQAIQGSGGAYIDTGVVFTGQKMKYIMDWSGGAGTYERLYGACTTLENYASSDSTGCIFFAGVRSEVLVNVGTTFVTPGIKASGKMSTELIVDSQGKYYEFIINDNRYTRTFTGDVNREIPIHLCRQNYQTTKTSVSKPFTGMVYSFSLEMDGVVVRNMLPARRDSDGVVGMYDTINDVFYGPADVGLFIAVEGDIQLPKGDYYITSVAGDRFGLRFDVGDWIISTGEGWTKVDNTDAVVAVNGMTGNVTLTANDVGAYTKEEVNDLIDDIELPDNILVNNATDANSIYIGNDLPQYADDGKGNILIGPASQITGYGSGNTVVGMGAYGKGYDGTSIGRSALSEGQWAVAVGYSANAKESGTIAVGCSAQANSENSVAIGRGSNSSGSWGIAIGKDANVTANGSTAIAIGGSSYATGINSIALGTNTRVNSNSEAAVALGANAIVNKNGNTAVGSKANVQDVYGTAVGYQSQAKGTASIAIGMNAKTQTAGDNGYNQIAIGKDASTQGKNAIAIGSEAQITDEEGIAVGNSSNSARHGIALGTRAEVSDFGGVAIGLNTTSDIVNAVAIGNQSRASGQDSVALGSSAVVADGAGFAVQLGVGTNSDANTLQFLDYKLLYDNGVIPYSRLTNLNSPSNGQTLVYDENEDMLVWSDATGGISEVKWGDITGSITDQTDLSNQFSNLSQSISDINDTIMEMTTKDESLQTQIDNLSAIGQFLAIWDCDTHIARYLDEGYTYQAGNYFIIGSVAAEGGTNYMPNGASYPGYTETTEDVKVSDMWFYDGEHWIYLANHERAIAVDAELNAESINPVENKAVTAAIVELQNRPTGVGVPQLASVDVLQLKTPEEAEAREQQYGNWMGMYSDIVVTLNLSKQEIIDRMYDLYLTVSRFKTNKNLTYDVDGEAKNYRNISKFSVMNDLRQKTNIRAYCWRMIYDDSLPETHPGRYAYFYTQDLYMDEQTCLENAHNIGLWGDYGSVACGPATCLNAIGWTNGYSANDYLHDYGDTTVGIERYEEGDVSEFANVADTSAYPEYNLKDHLVKRECRRYTRDGENYYFWCDNWEDSKAAIYNITDGNDNPIPNGIPKHMDELFHVWNVFDFPSTFEFVDKRPDLNYKAVVNDPYGFFEALQNLTFKGKYVDGDGRPTYWNCYWFDFPIMPVLLKDCEVRVMSNATKEDYSASVNSGEWHTLEYLSNNGLLHGLRDDKPVEIKLPYNTYYLWMRFCSLQKRCAYGDYSNWLDEEGRGIDYPMWPEQKLNLVEGVRDNNVLGKRAFARPRQAYRYGEYGKISEYIQFNVCSPMDAASGTKSKATPIQKKLTIDKNATTTIRN